MGHTLILLVGFLVTVATLVYLKVPVHEYLMIGAGLAGLLAVLCWMVSAKRTAVRMGVWALVLVGLGLAWQELLKESSALTAQLEETDWTPFFVVGLGLLAAAGLWAYAQGRQAMLKLQKLQGTVAQARPTLRTRARIVPPEQVRPRLQTPAAPHGTGTPSLPSPMQRIRALVAPTPSSVPNERASEQESSRKNDRSVRLRVSAPGNDDLGLFGGSQ